MRTLTDKTWFIYYKGFQIWINDEQAQQVRKLMLAGNQYLDIDGRMIKLDEVALLKGEDNDRAEKLRRGDWKCEYGYWHAKGDQCGHGLSRPALR